MAKPKIVYYHDGRHPHIYRYEPPMYPEEYQACVDELATTSVEALMFGLAEGRTMLHDTRAGELWGHNVDKWDHLVFKRAHQNARSLIDAGFDPLRLVCDRGREKGILIYPTLLVQNGGGEFCPVRCSNFRFDNPHLEIGARGDLDPGLPGVTGLDFKHREVREERFAIVEEAVNEYPVDGFELNLNYQDGIFFHPDEVEAGRAIMTDWIGRIHEEVKRGGDGRELAIRVPLSLEDCAGIGFDPEEWIRLGIVDVLAPEPITGPHRLDPNLDFTPYLKAAAGTKTRILAVLHARVGNDRIGDGPVAMTRAAACNYWDQGVDGLYVAQWFQQWPYEGQFYEKLRELPHPDIMAARDKYYYVPTQIDTPWNPLTPTALPAVMEPNEPAEARFVVSDDLPHWHERGPRPRGAAAAAGISNVTEIDGIRFELNGAELPGRICRRINQAYRMNAPRHRSGPTCWFVFRLEPEQWPVRGENRLAATPDPQGPAPARGGSPARPRARDQVPHGEELPPRLRRPRPRPLRTQRDVSMARLEVLGHGTIYRNPHPNLASEYVAFPSIQALPDDTLLVHVPARERARERGREGGHPPFLGWRGDLGPRRTAARAGGGRGGSAAARRVRDRRGRGGGRLRALSDRPGGVGTAGGPLPGRRRHLVTAAGRKQPSLREHGTRGQPGDPVGRKPDRRGRVGG